MSEAKKLLQAPTTNHASCHLNNERLVVTIYKIPVIALVKH